MCEQLRLDQVDVSEQEERVARSWRMSSRVGHVRDAMFTRFTRSGKAGVSAVFRVARSAHSAQQPRLLRSGIIPLIILSQS